MSSGFCAPHTQSHGSPCCLLRIHTENHGSLRSCFLSVLYSDSLCISRVKLPINVIPEQQNKQRLQAFCFATTNVNQDFSQHTTALKNLSLPNKMPPLQPFSLTHTHSLSLFLYCAFLPPRRVPPPQTQMLPGLTQAAHFVRLVFRH